MSVPIVCGDGCMALKQFAFALSNARNLGIRDGLQDINWPGIGYDIDD